MKNERKKDGKKKKRKRKKSDSKRDILFVLAYMLMGQAKKV